MIEMKPSLKYCLLLSFRFNCIYAGPLGLDDVVVTYNSGEKLFVQVKHTRVEDTLTFGDLVSPEGGAKKSLLSVLAQSWDKVNGKYEHSKVMLFTNRTAGERAVKTRARHPVHRPALSEFVPAMKQRIQNDRGKYEKRDRILL